MPTAVASVAPRAQPRPENAPQPSAPAAVARGSLLSAFRFAGIGPNGGLRLGRVARGTLPDLLGLKTGDEVIALNGFRIAEPQQAILAYARLPYTDDWVARISRDGALTEIRYALR